MKIEIVPGMKTYTVDKDDMYTERTIEKLEKKNQQVPRAYGLMTIEICLKRVKVHVMKKRKKKHVTVR